MDIATSTDVDSIVRLVNAAYRGSSKGWTNEQALLAGQRTDAASVKGLMNGEGAVILLARDRDSLIGCVALQPQNDNEWYLSMLAVDPNGQTQGTGKTIMRDAEAYARARGAQRMKISVINARDTLIAWYERRGYTRTGVVDPFPYDDPNVGTPLRDDLKLVMLTKSL